MNDRPVAPETRDTRDTIDARDSRDTLDARDSRDTLDTRDSRDTLDARDSRDTMDARDSRDTMDARSTRQPQTVTGETDSGFLPDDRMQALRARWSDVQAGFVDDPQNAVQNAHALVADLVNELTQTFSNERTNLESQWKGGGTADTEQLRVALQRYRSFFNRLLGT